MNVITTTLLPNGEVLVTFMIDDDRPASVVGDFNGWDPHRDPFVEEIDGRRYVTVSVPADTVTCFAKAKSAGPAVITPFGPDWWSSRRAPPPKCSRSSP